MKRSKPLARRTRLRPHSPRRLKQQANRRLLTLDMLATIPGCCRCGHRADCLHEPQKRSRNPAAWLDEHLVVPSCNSCNAWAELNVTDATECGWLIPSTTSYADATAIVADLIARPLWSR